MLDLLDGRPTERANVTLTPALKKAAVELAEFRKQDLSQLVRHLLVSEVQAERRRAERSWLSGLSDADRSRIQEQYPSHFIAGFHAGDLELGEQEEGDLFIVAPPGLDGWIVLNQMAGHTATPVDAKPPV